jgi:type IV secretory pathway VirJ component
VRGAAALAAVLLATRAAHAAPRDAFEFGRFGRVALERETDHPAHVVLFLSGDGGWNKGVVDMAHALAGQDALVIGIDVAHYLREVAASREECSFFAADFEALSQQVQKKLGRPHYTPPVLVGYSSGATLAYATLVQAPPNTFRGAISLGFCPDLPLTKPACRGQGLEAKRRADGKGFDFLPDAKLASPWIALQGEIDQVCDTARTAAFVREVGHAEIVMLPKVGHGFSVPRNWLPQLRDAFSRVAGSDGLVGGRRPAAKAQVSVADLPLVEVPAAAPAGDRLAVVVSGDGGWAGLDREVAGVLAARGVPVVGLDSLQYFWTRRTPGEAGATLKRLLDHYLAAWQKRRVILIGYSRGADVLPFMASRLPARLREVVVLIALLGPGRTAEFEFHVADWLLERQRPVAQAVLPEVVKLRDRKLLCVFGSAEAASLCPTLPEGMALLDERRGAHHFAGDYASIAERILAEAGG